MGFWPISPTHGRSQTCTQIVVIGQMGESEEDEEQEKVIMGGFSGKVRMVREAEEEIMLVWGLQQPTYCKQNAFVVQSSLLLPLDACGRSLSILQSPSSLVSQINIIPPFPFLTYCLFLFIINSV